MRICISSSARLSRAETFIQDQISFFSKCDQVSVIHDGRLGERNESDKLLASPFFWVMHQLVKGTTGIRNNYFGEQAVKNLLIKNKIELVLANYGLTGAHLLPICNDLNIPLLVIFHGHDATDRKILGQYKNRYIKLFQQAHGVIAVSNDLQNQLIQLSANTSNLHVIPCGVNTTIFNLPENRSNTKTFLTVGRFVEKKGPLYTVQAFHKVWLKHPDANLIMGGPHSSLFEQCVNMVKELGMSNVVSFPGALSHAQVSKLMHTATAFVQHSVTAPNGDTEGTPVSILEASACGLPVISTQHGGIKEAVIDGETGILVPEKDVNLMAGAMIEILENPKMAMAFGQAGRTHIERNYDQKNQLAKVRELALNATSSNLLT